MKYGLLKTIGICAAVLSVGMSCYAKETSNITYKYNESQIIVSGNAAEGENFITFQILKSGKEFDKAYADTDILYCDQMTPIDGRYEFVVEYDCSGGKYAARLAANKGIKDTFELTIITDDDLRTAYGELNLSATNNDFGEFKRIVNEKRNELNFGFSLSDGKTLSNEILDYFDYVKKNELLFENESDNTKIFKTFITADVLNTKGLDNINAVADSIYLTEELVKDYHTIAATEGVQKYFTQKISGKDIASTEEFEKEFKKALILTNVRYANGTGDVERIFEKYGSVANITGTASDEVYRKLMGQDFDDCDKLNDKYKELRGEKKGSSTTNEHKGGGSGGSFRGDYKMDNIDDIVNNETISVSFEDIDGVAWAQEAILALADKDIINGKDDKIFAPDDEITREEFTKIIVGAMNLYDGRNVTNGFKDVNEDDWFFEYVNIAREEKIVSGIGDGLFGVGEFITREDMTVMIYNALKIRNAELNVAKVEFDDSVEISDYAVDAVNALYNMGAVNGVSEREFMPKGLATRAQAAKVIYGVIDKLR